MADGKDWARQILHRKRCGMVVPMFSFNAAKEVLGVNL